MNELFFGLVCARLCGQNDCGADDDGRRIVYIVHCIKGGGRDEIKIIEQRMTSQRLQLIAIVNDQFSKTKQQKENNFIII